MSASQGTHRAGRGGRRAAQHGRRAEAGPAERDTLRRLLPQTLVLMMLAGGASAFVTHDKVVELSVDGESRSVRTFAGSVAELLEREGVEVTGRDLVAPAPHERLTDGDTVAVRYGRPVTLTLDGSRRQLWTTAHTVSGALRQLGVRAEGAHLSASRSRRIGLRGMELYVRTERSVSVLADGRVRQLRTNAATVRDVLDDAGISLGEQDVVSVPLSDFPRDGQTVSVQRVTADTRTREETIPFPVERIPSAEHQQGTEVVRQQGVPGVRRVVYEQRTVDGRALRARRVSAKVVREPRAQVVLVGTRPQPTSVGGADHLNWAALARCESGGRPNAVDPSGSYGGLYQFDVRTWQSVGGSGRPQDASAAEQTYRAKRLYVQRGASPWPVCGRKLHQ
ncbi:resuscitation-promoting factor [Streptomyces alkaliterrae]|nr:resuscitation-promoting factor [Streptomyces alkaliterrae]